MKKIFVLLFSLLAILFLAAAPPQAGKEYRVLILGDTHYNDLKFNADKVAAKGRVPYVKMWQDGDSQRLLTAAAKQAGKLGAVCAFQLGDIAQGGVATPELMRGMLGEAYATIRSHSSRFVRKIIKNIYYTGVLL